MVLRGMITYNDIAVAKTFKKVTAKDKTWGGCLVPCLASRFVSKQECSRIFSGDRQLQKKVEPHARCFVIDRCTMRMCDTIVIQKIRAQRNLMFCNAQQAPDAFVGKSCSVLVFVLLT
jgi:hypothetical protein